MAPSFETLGDNCVAASMLQPASLFDRCCGGNELGSRCLDSVDEHGVWQAKMEADDARIAF
ncbi:hypothetical protein AXW83_21270 [Bosea sp. PAMC 26642]|nr:hypothetical protein AXW83_21270 [Bosea sp. PAMC 26642]